LDYYYYYTYNYNKVDLNKKKILTVISDWKECDAKYINKTSRVGVPGQMNQADAWRDPHLRVAYLTSLSGCGRAFC
jgi:hypothetical protein